MDESGSALSTKVSLCCMWPAFLLSRHWFQMKSVPPLGRTILRDRGIQCLQFHLSVFASAAHVLSVLVKQSVLIPMCRISLIVSARSFRALDCTLKYLVHSWLVLLCGVRQRFGFLLCVNEQFPKTICWKGCCFPYCIFWENSFKTSQKWKMSLYQTISLPGGIFPRKLKSRSQGYVCLPMFIAELFIIAEMKKQPLYLYVYELMKKMKEVCTQHSSNQLWKPCNL